VWNFWSENMVNRRKEVVLEMRVRVAAWLGGRAKLERRAGLAR
jgi:hypothetical protein